MADILIYTKDYCPYCTKAKTLLTRKGQTFREIDITHDDFFNEDSLFQNEAIWEVLNELRSRGHIYEASEREGATEEKKAAAAWKKPATWFRSTTFGDQEDRVLVKSDGVPTYTLPDVVRSSRRMPSAARIFTMPGARPQSGITETPRDSASRLNFF